MPLCRAAMAATSQRIKAGVRFALVRGLPTEQMSDDEGRALFRMLSAMIMRAVAQKLDGTLAKPVDIDFVGAGATCDFDANGDQINRSFLHQVTGRGHNRIMGTVSRGGARRGEGRQRLPPCRRRWRGTRR